MKRKIFTAGILIMLLMLCLTGAALAETAAEGTWDAEGSGENITWVLDDAGTLTVSGTGDMKGFKENYGNPLYEHRFSVEKIVIGEGITSVGQYVFYGFCDAEEVTIPEGVKSIGRAAFAGCSSLTSLDLPESLESIDDCAFSLCTSLKKVVIPDHVTTLGDAVFNECTGLKSLTIPASCTTIGSCPGEGCVRLTSAGPIGSGCAIEFGWTDSIPAHAFKKSLLEKITIPDTVTTIGKEAFSHSSLKSITIPDSVTTIGQCAFYYSSLESITLPEGVTTIGMGAFQGSNVKNITLPLSLETIGGSAFANIPQSAVVNFRGTEDAWKSEWNECFTEGVTFRYAKRGKCGDDLYWEIDDNGKLTISGTGAMYTYGHSEYEFVECPFVEYASEITEVEFGKEVRHIEGDVFETLTSIKKATVLNPVMRIDFKPLAECTQLTDLWYNGTTREWNNDLPVVYYNSDECYGLWGNYAHVGERVVDWSGVTVHCMVTDGWSKGFWNSYYTYYLVDGEYVTDWKQIDGEWYYFRNDATIWRAGCAMIERDGDLGWYYLDDETGAAWRKTFYTLPEEVGSASFYFENSGRAVKKPGWKKINKKWYYFATFDFTPYADMFEWTEEELAAMEGTACYVVSGLIEDNGKTYMLDADGVMAADEWIEIEGVNTYFNKYGARAEGWTKIGGEWYCFNANGSAKKSEWVESGKKKYYLDEDGVMLANGWYEVDGTEYYFDRYGARADGWVRISGKWHYIENGTDEKKSCWITDNGKDYYLDENGVMLTDTEKDGRKINKYGVAK